MTDRGFTLIELLVVIAISAILMAVALPSFRGFAEGSGLHSGRAALRSALELARSEALARSGRVGVCRSTDANEAAPSCSTTAAGGFGGNDWAAGWIVYAKAAANTGAVFEAGDVIVRRHPALAIATDARRLAIWAPAAGSVVFDWNGLRVAGLTGSFLFDWSGDTARPAVARSTRALCLAVNVAGRTEALDPAAGVCA